MLLPAAIATALALGVAGAQADDAASQDSLLKSLMKAGGFATDVGPPKDFVQRARPQGGDEYVPIFRPPLRKSKPKTAAELKAMEADFSAVQARHDAMRAAFPPSAKAVAEQKAAEAAKAKKKKKAPLLVGQ